MEIPECVGLLRSSRFINILKRKGKRRIFSPSTLVFRGGEKERTEGQY